MKKELPELEDAIKLRDYKKIGLLSHSIKGSSGNFRIDILQVISSEMEKMAKANSIDYNYEENFEKIKNKIQKIKIK